MNRETEAARLPTLVLLEDELVKRASVGQSARWRTHSFAVAVAALLLVLALGALTPFGRAVAEELAELVGIGDEPSREQDATGDEPAVVIGVGQAPSGESFEIVASTEPAVGQPVGEATCISLDFPATSGPVTAACLTEALLTEVDRKGIAAGAVRGSGRLAESLLVTGLVEPSAELVVAEHGVTGRERTEAELAVLDPELAEVIGSRDRVTFFVAFLPRPGQPGLDDRTLRVRTFDAMGHELARQALVATSPSEPMP